MAGVQISEQIKRSSSWCTASYRDKTKESSILIGDRWEYRHFHVNNHSVTTSDALNNKSFTKCSDVPENQISLYLSRVYICIATFMSQLQFVC